MLREKALGLIQEWADGFVPLPSLESVRQAYAALRRQGVEFPGQDMDAMAPIYTPESSALVAPGAALGLGGAEAAVAAAAAAATMQADEEMARALVRTLVFVRVRVRVLACAR